MLEHDALFIEPPRVGPQGVYRPIRDEPTRRVLGHAFRTPRANSWNVFRPRTETVYEAPDGSLLCSVSRRWWLGERVVFEADHRAVAELRGRLVLSAEGRLIAERSLWHPPGEFRGIGGQVIARWHRAPQGLCLRFDALIEGEPLVRMALLGAVLML